MLSFCIKHPYNTVLFDCKGVGACNSLRREVGPGGDSFAIRASMTERSFSIVEISSWRTRRMRLFRASKRLYRGLGVSESTVGRVEREEARRSYPPLLGVSVGCAGSCLGALVLGFDLEVEIDVEDFLLVVRRVICLVVLSGWEPLE